MLYTGEFYDSHLGFYYNRARYYNPSVGRFNRLDPFAGTNRDPQSLHKYLYAHCNPINGMDPTGRLFGGLVELTNSMSVRALVFWMIHGAGILKAVTTAVYVTGAVYATSSVAVAFMEWGYLPHDLRGYAEAVQYYSGVGFVLSLSALVLLSTLPDPRQTARPAQRVARLQRDEAVDGRPAPRRLPTSRPVADNAGINAEKNRDVLRLRQQGAMEVRVDQRQVTFGDSGVVQKGWNRPDNQGVFENGPTTAIEYDTRLARLILRRDRILANEPQATVILKWFDDSGNYTIVP